MLSEQIFTSICGPPIAANTAISKDIGIYAQTLNPSYAVKSAFKKSSTPARCLAVTEDHVFAAQDQKAHVHVYSRQRGNQEALVTFPERIRSLSIVSENVLVCGTTEGRLILWETCTGRQIITPPCHLQAVTCLATTSHCILSGSADSNVNVWSLAHLLDLNPQGDPEPERILSNHRGAVTDLVVGPGASPDSRICVSASQDKTCIVWNYASGQVLRTLLFPGAPLCASLDPSARSLAVCLDNGAMFLAELFGEKALIGSSSAELASIVVQVDQPLGVADVEAGAPNCLAFNYDGMTVLTGHTKGKILRWTLVEDSHPTELADLNASVSNIITASPLPTNKPCRPASVVKPKLTKLQYTYSARLDGESSPQTRLSGILTQDGFSESILQEAYVNLHAAASDTAMDAEGPMINQDTIGMVKGIMTR